ncbi:MAG: RNA polymerase sigma factor [Polyangia bacterium]
MDSRQPDRMVSLHSASAAELSDIELVRAVVGGDKVAFREVWDRYLTPVRATLRSCLGGGQVVDDLTQEVFLSFYRAASRIRDPSALRPYLLGVAARLASMEIRSRSRRDRRNRLFYWSSPEHWGGRAPDIDERDALRCLRGLLAMIPERERQAFVLRYVQDLSPEEVAQALRIPKGTAKRAIAKGRSLVLLRARKDAALMQYLESGQERAQ